MFVSEPAYLEKDNILMFSIHKLMNYKGNRNDGGFCI